MNNADLKVHCSYTEIVKIEDLKPNPENPNRHPESQIKLLAKILRENGWRRPITVSARSGYIVRGHGTLEAAKLAGFTMVPIDRQDYESDADEMTDLLADNQIAELSEWDPYQLAKILDELKDEGIDIEFAGFTADDLEKLNLQVSIPDDLEFKEYDESTEKGVKKIVCPKCGHEIAI